MGGGPPPRGDDLEVYRASGRALLDGRNPYTQGLVGTPLPCTYTPFSAVPFVPLAFLSTATAMFWWTLLQLGCLWFVVRRAVGAIWSTMDPTRVEVATLAVVLALQLSNAVSASVDLGQVNFALMALVVGDVLRRRPSRGQGVWIGLATAFKLTPGIFVLYLLVTRRYRAAANAVGAFAATVAVGWLVMPGGSRSFWVDRVGTDPAHNTVPGYLSNVSLLGMFSRWTGYPASRPWWLLACVPVLVGGGWLCRRLHVQVGDLGGLAAAAAVGALVSPISWTHHLTWFVLPALLLARHALAAGSRRATLLVVAFVVPFYVSPLWLVDPSRWPSEHFARWEAAVGTFYTGLLVVVLGATAWWLSRSGTSARPSGAGHRDVADDEARQVVAAG